MRKSTLAIVLVLALGLAVLAGCGGKSATTSSDTGLDGIKVTGADDFVRILDGEKSQRFAMGGLSNARNEIFSATDISGTSALSMGSSCST